MDEQVRNGRSQPGKAAPVGEMGTIHPYRSWQEAQGIPRYTGYYLEDLATVELGRWEQRGGSGAFVNLEGTGGVNDLQILEIPAGGQATPQHHMYEALVYAVSGRGSASVWYDPAQRHTFEWGTGSLFSIPLNARYQLFNGSGNQAARLIMVTNAPTIMNLFHSEEFMFDNPFVFRDRFPGSDAGEFFSGEGRLYRRGRNHIWETNFVADVRSFPLYEWAERGAGGRNVLFELAHSSMAAHISEFPVGTYKKAHRHGPGAHVIILNGKGYSTLWPEGTDEVRCEWRPNSVVVPPQNWFHQHFNTGPTPARYLALKFAGRRYFLSDVYVGDKADVSVKAGGVQVEYQDEDPRVHQQFEAALAANGAACGMAAQVPWCTARAAAAV